MVNYKSDGVFEAPVEKVWKLLTEEHTPEKVVKIHSNIQKVKILQQTPTSQKQEVTAQGPDGKPMVYQLQFTFKPPQGFDMAWLTGPFTGSKCTHTYTPMGAKTKVVVSGDFKCPGMDDKSIVKIVDDMMGHAFDADNAYLRSMR